MPENTSRVTGVTQSPRSVRRASVTETVLYSFLGVQPGSTRHDGGNPEGGLTYFKGILYGTTSGGGRNYSGTVFSITPSGTYTILYSFEGLFGDGDGTAPEARLIVLKGTLYGTTLYGGEGGGNRAGPCSQEGSRGRGTVFSITPSGQETVVHTFLPAREGHYPQAALLNVNGTLYGTTCGGGVGANGGGGTVFTIAPSGDYHVIHSFQLPGGAPPSHGRLLYLNGTLYGTASGGGKYGEGAAFSLSTSGSEKLLYSFKGGNKDGANPVGGLTAIKRTLYGTTQSGGAYGHGTVFSITPTGTETVLHSFRGLTSRRVSDGSGPAATLLNVNGTLYGTTSSGGASNKGTVFSITLSGHETVLYSFTGGTGGGVDGVDPQSGLNYLNGTFYGTTYSGGAYGSGTVYSITL
jgi:uncharacterized repeat protein (TIGR03803 family)